MCIYTLCIYTHAYTCTYSGMPTVCKHFFNIICKACVILRPPCHSNIFSMVLLDTVWLVSQSDRVSACVGCESVRTKRREGGVGDDRYILQCNIYHALQQISNKKHHAHIHTYTHARTPIHHTTNLCRLSWHCSFYFSFLYVVSLVLGIYETVPNH